MEFQYTIYVAPLLAAALVSTWVAIYSWMRRSNRAAISLALLSGAITVWLVGYALEIAGVGLQTKIFWGKVQYLGIAFAPLMWFFFAFNHANQTRRLNHIQMILLAVVPFITVLLAFTTEMHHLIWDAMSIGQTGDFSYLDVGHGAWFNFVHFPYSYGLLLAGTIIVIRSVGRMQGLYRGQAIALVLAVVAPWVGNISHLLGVNPDPTAFSFVITVVALAWGIFGFQLINLLPVARDIVVDEMGDGMIVLDAHNRIADINPAAVRLIDMSAAQVLGQPVAEALKTWPQIIEQYKDVAETRDEISVGAGSEQRWYELRLSPLNDRRSHLIGRVITIRDITASKRAEQLKQSFLDDIKALQQLQLVLSEINELDSLYVKMISLSQQRLGIDRVALFLLDNKTNELLGTVGVDEKGNARDEHYYREVITPDHWTLEILHAPDHVKIWDDALLFDNGVPVGTGWKAAATLWDGRQAVGYLVCDNFLSKRPARPYESELISLLGSTFGHLIGHKRADEQVRQLSRAVESSPTSIVITDVDGKIQYVNSKFSEVTGYSFQEALGQNPRILKTDQTAPDVHKQLWETIKAGKEWHGEFCNRKKNGELYWELASISPISNADGMITHYVAIKEDITEQREVREQVKKQNDYLSILHQVTLDLLDRRNLDDLLQAIVDRAAALLDAPFGEIMLKEGNDLVVRSYTKNQPQLFGDRVSREAGQLTWKAHDTHQPVILDDYSLWPARRTIYTDTPLHGVADFPVMVGEECIAVLAMGRSKADYPFKPDQIQIGVLFAQMVSLVLDNANLYNSALQEIAERKRTEALLQASEARYRQIVENAGDIIYRTDANGHFTYVNPIGLHLMGAGTEAELLGKHYLDMATPETRPELKHFYRRQYISRESNTYHEFPAVALDGGEVWLGQNVQLIYEGDAVIGFQAVARDITELKRAQDALGLARDQALEASRMKSQLLAKVSHELRTPLGGVLGYAELLHYDSFGTLTDEQKEATGQIIQSANYLTNMVNELLDEAQIETKAVTLHQEPFSPAELLEKLQDGVIVLAQSKGLELHTRLAADLPAVLYGDPHRLQQILINLTGNAIKFTRSGEVCIEFSRADETHWSIQVSDTGVGIPKEAQSYIFEPFRQVDNSITYDNRGSGLGLSITKQLVELMGGEISVESEVNRGSTFSVCLPILNKVEEKV